MDTPVVKWIYRGPKAKSREGRRVQTRKKAGEFEKGRHLKTHFATPQEFRKKQKQFCSKTWGKMRPWIWRRS